MRANAESVRDAVTGRLIRLPEVRRLVPLCRATIYQLISQGKFPKPVGIGGRAVAWIETEVEAWVEAKVRAARGGSEAA
jgi:prophage regulatory protein